MAKRIAEIAIGKRAYTEVLRLFERKIEAAIAIGCDRKTINEWGYGVAPSAIYLVRLHELGANVMWILTGKENKNAED